MICGVTRKTKFMAFTRKSIILIIVLTAAWCFTAAAKEIPSYRVKLVHASDNPEVIVDDNGVERQIYCSESIVNRQALAYTATYGGYISLKISSCERSQRILSDTIESDIESKHLVNDLDRDILGVSKYNEQDAVIAPVGDIAAIIEVEPISLESRIVISKIDGYPAYWGWRAKGVVPCPLNGEEIAGGWRCLEVREPYFSEDGRTLIYVLTLINDRLPWSSRTVSTIAKYDVGQNTSEIIFRSVGGTINLPSISEDKRRLVFAGSGEIIEDDKYVSTTDVFTSKGSRSDIYLIDLSSRLVRNLTGTGRGASEGDSVQPHIAGNGLSLVFTSSATKIRNLRFEKSTLRVLQYYIDSDLISLVSSHKKSICSGAPDAWQNVASPFGAVVFCQKSTLGSELPSVLPISSYDGSRVSFLSLDPFTTLDFDWFASVKAINSWWRGVGSTAHQFYPQFPIADDINSYRASAVIRFMGESDIVSGVRDAMRVEVRNEGSTEVVWRTPLYGLPLTPSRQWMMPHSTAVLISARMPMQVEVPEVGKRASMSFVRFYEGPVALDNDGNYK